MTSVVVFDYGFGNVRSMVRALMSLGLDVTLTSDQHQAIGADGMVVPGVGAFSAIDAFFAVYGVLSGFAVYCMRAGGTGFGTFAAEGAFFVVE